MDFILDYKLSSVEVTVGFAVGMYELSGLNKSLFFKAALNVFWEKAL